MAQSKASKIEYKRLCLWEKYLTISKPAMATLNNRNELSQVADTQRNFY